MNDEIISDHCDYDPDTGEEYDLLTRWEKREEFEGSYERSMYFIDQSPEPVESRPILYSLYRDISNRLNVKLFRSINELIDTIDIDSNSKDKWLIFVNTIKTGKQLCQDLKQKGISNDDVIFINAACKKYGEGKEQVDCITNNQSSKSKILICTSVLDNGINLNDIKLKT